MFGAKKKKETPIISAVVLAAPPAEGATPGDLPVDETSVVLRAACALGECRFIREIIIVCEEAMIGQYYALVQDYGPEQVASVVGNTGRGEIEAIASGVSSCVENAQYIVVHDGLRPFVELQTLEDCIAAAQEHGAACAAVKVNDTIKAQDQNGYITASPDRSKLVALQSPQVYKTAVLKAAIALARHKNHTDADICSMVQQSGQKIFVCAGSYQNMRISSQQDLSIAEALLSCQGDENTW